jgi:hypothetical protein
MSDPDTMRIETVVSQMLSMSRHSSFPVVMVQVMEICEDFTDMTGPQKTALVRNVMGALVDRAYPEFSPLLPTVEAFCEQLVQASKGQLHLNRVYTKSCLGC